MKRVIDWKTLKTMVPYSRQHIGRLESDDKFPKRVQLGPCRVGWLLSEVEAWIDERTDAR